MKIELQNKTYDFLNSLVRIILPALGTLYFTLSSIWGLPYANEVVGTIAAVSLFGGIVIQLARNDWQYEDELLVTSDSFGLESGKRMEEFEDGQVVTIKVHKVETDLEDDRGDF